MKIIYKGKEKTFFDSFDANRFIGTHIPEMLHKMVTPQLYYELNRFEFWDDNSLMTGEEWAVIVKYLLSNFEEEIR